MTQAKEQKFRLSFSREELVTLAKSLEANHAELLENAALILSLKKAIRKIDFQILEPAFSSSSQNPLVSKASETLVKELEAETLAKLSRTYEMTPELLSPEEIDKVIIFRCETGLSMTGKEKELFNAALARKMGF